MIEDFFSKDPKGITKQAFNRQAFDPLYYYSYDEIDNLFNKINEDWAVDKDATNDDLKHNNKVWKIYNLVNTFSSIVLTEDNGHPVVKFEHLLRWRELSHRLGEDLFTCNFWAYKDLKSNAERNFFAWKPIISTDNSRLKTLLSKGLAENHFHLFGSAPYCELSWIALMNDITGRLPQFKKIFKKGKLHHSDRDVENDNYKLYFLTLKAAVIRAHLFSILEKGFPLFHFQFEKGTDNLKDGNCYKFLESLLKGESSKNECEIIASQIPAIQNEIDLFRYELGLKIENIEIADYAISNKNSIIEFNSNVLLSGERWFLYKIFRKLKEEPENSPNYIHLHRLFYIYLLCKSNFRDEMVQINNKKGFDNFNQYQDRKEIFLLKSKIFSKAITKMAIHTSRENQHIESFETRITPGKIKDIRKIDKIIFQKKSDHLNSILSKEKKLSKEEHFYTIHFIKSKDELNDNRCIAMVQPRHYHLRQKIKEQANQIVYLRNNRFNNIASRILGIDAASHEIYARPEVFAPVFRYLKHHHENVVINDIMQFQDKKLLPSLFATYHVGEDFLDIVDGLRAIDEAVEFLELAEGDRIGHAMALGVNVRDYYNFKHRQLLLPRQDVLDNYSWLLSRLVKYGMNDFMALQQLVEHEFRVQYQKIYGHLDLKVDPIFYYQSWTLRRDDPKIYESGEYPKNPNFITEYDHFLLSDYKNADYRNIKDVVKILYAYHYDPDVKRIGAQIKRFDVSDDYIKAVEIIQKHMQFEIAKKHIAIECNPSSNVLIGTFNRYDKHPIINFYNLGLTSEYETIKKCPQLMVSINTDDQGVFNTYLENEYAYMAKALEKAKDNDGKPLYNISMIYDWLERIRQMGLEMSFKTPK
jgi:adenosine deaminase